MIEDAIEDLGTEDPETILAQLSVTNHRDEAWIRGYLKKAQMMKSIKYGHKLGGGFWN